MNIGVLASHQGTTLQAVLDAISDGHLDACVTIVISNNPEKYPRRLRCIIQPLHPLQTDLFR